MKRPHVLQVQAEARAFGDLLSTAAAEGLRGGWLELGEEAPEADPGLAAAAAEGALRAVAVGGGRSATVKPIKGLPVLDDLLREHFLGCRFVLLRGSLDHVLTAGGDGLRLSVEGDGWRLDGGGVDRVLSTRELVTALRRPRLTNGTGEGKGVSETQVERISRT